MVQFLPLFTKFKCIGFFIFFLNTWHKKCSIYPKSTGK